MGGWYNIQRKQQSTNDGIDPPPYGMTHHLLPPPYILPTFLFGGSPFAISTASTYYIFFQAQKDLLKSTHSSG